jgi:hypothetical protein
MEELEVLGFEKLNLSSMVYKDKDGYVQYLISFADTSEFCTIFRVVADKFKDVEIFGYPVVYAKTSSVYDIVEDSREFLKKEIESEILYVTPQLREKILNSYSWVKVKRFDASYEDLKADPNTNWKLEYQELMEHHEKETNFLINYIRKIVE